VERLCGKPRGLFLLEMRFLTSAESRAAPAKRRSTAAFAGRGTSYNPARLSACCMRLFPEPQSWLGATGRHGAARSSAFFQFHCYFCFPVLGCGRVGLSLLPSPLHTLVSPVLPSHCLSVPGQDGRKRVHAGRGQAPGSQQKEGEAVGAAGEASLPCGSRDAR